MPMPVQSAPDARGGQTARGERAVTVRLSLSALIEQALTLPQRPRLVAVVGYPGRGIVVMSECQTLGTAPLLAGPWPFLTDKPCWQ